MWTETGREAGVRMKLLYCPVCDRHYNEARVVSDILIRARLSQPHESHSTKIFKVVDEMLVGRWTGVTNLVCILGDHELELVEVKDCPHEYIPSPSVVMQTCRFCGNKRYGKVVFE